MSKVCDGINIAPGLIRSARSLQLDGAHVHSTECSALPPLVSVMFVARQVISDPQKGRQGAVPMAASERCVITRRGGSGTQVAILSLALLATIRNDTE